MKDLLLLLLCFISRFRGVEKSRGEWGYKNGIHKKVFFLCYGVPAHSDRDTPKEGGVGLGSGLGRPGLGLTCDVPHSTLSQGQKLSLPPFRFIADLGPFNLAPPPLILAPVPLHTLLARQSPSRLSKKRGCAPPPSHLCPWGFRQGWPRDGTLTDWG